MTRCPTVSIVIPVLDAAETIDMCFRSIEQQTYPGIVETLVADGGSVDGTAEAAAARGATVVANPHRIQAAGLNLGIARARGEVIVRVDARTVVAPDYVEACVAALLDTGAAMVGGAQVPMPAGSAVARGIALAMGSRFGAGTAAFRDPHRSGWVDTVYLGAYWREDCLAVGGYDVEKPTNEDAEFALRLSERGGVWLDERIRSHYVPRSSLGAVAKQYYLYGKGRGHTTRRYPSSVRPRQMAPLLLLASVLSPLRRPAVLVYGVSALLAYRQTMARDVPASAVAVVVTPVMHLAWAMGFLRSLATR